MICSDSLSCLLAIESCKTQIPFILKIVEIYKSIVAIDKHVIVTWIPSHIGIHGNTVVVWEAKDALDDPVSHWSLPYTDFKFFIMKFILYILQSTIVCFCWLPHNRAIVVPIVLRNVLRKFFSVIYIHKY